MAAVKVAAIEIENNAVGNEQHVHVGWQQQRHEEQGQRPYELIRRFVGDDRKGGRVMESMVMLVYIPAHACGVPEPVVPPLVAVRPTS